MISERNEKFVVFKKFKGFAGSVSAPVVIPRRGVLLEAVPAVYRFSLCRFEGNLTFVSTV